MGALRVVIGFGIPLSFILTLRKLLKKTLYTLSTIAKRQPNPHSNATVTPALNLEN